MMKVSGTFIAANAVATNVQCGFVPDHVHLLTDLAGATNELEFEWFKALADAETSGRWGIAFSSTGVPAAAASAAAGIIAYDTSNENVNVESPVPGKGKVAVSITDWTSSVSTAATARSGTAIGTMIRPTTHNGYVYECTTAGTSSGTEPTSYPTIPGQTVTDNDVVFTCRDEEIVRGGARGFTLGATASINGQICAFTAELHDRHEDMGDADDTNPVTFK